MVWTSLPAGVSGFSLSRHQYSKPISTQTYRPFRVISHPFLAAAPRRPSAWDEDPPVEAIILLRTGRLKQSLAVGEEHFPRHASSHSGGPCPPQPLKSCPGSLFIAWNREPFASDG